METIVDIGYVSGFLTVTRETDERIRRGVVFECQCVCGNTVKVSKSMLRLKEKKSCGCKNKAETSGTHGWYGTITHNTWRTVKDRCLNSKHKSYKYYGGRGIKVCDRWLESFENFLEDMGEREGGSTLGRLDLRGDYTKENCYWTVKRNFSYESVYIDGSSPSGLSWLTGEIAGNIRDDGYWTIGQPKRYVHRVIWEIYHGKIPRDRVIDHVDGNPANNLLSNLRLVSVGQNLMNQKIRKDSKTGVTGVSVVKRKGEIVGYQASGLNTKSGTKTFFFSVHGVDGALKLACEALENYKTDERRIYSRKKPN